MPKNKPLERRAYAFDIGAEEGGERGYILTGRPIVYNSRTNIGPFDEIIESGALNRTDLRDVRFLVNHDTDGIPLARSRRNNFNNTMQFTVDEQGLWLDYVQLDVENNAEARALWSAVNRGDISGMSFMFSVEADRWEDLESDHPVRYITSIGSVVEVSAVTFPCYEATEIYARDAKAALESARAALESARLAAANDPLPEGRSAELELEKAKIKIIGGTIQ